MNILGYRFHSEVETVYENSYIVSHYIFLIVTKYCMVSTCTNYTSTNFSAIGIKFTLVEFVISKFLLVEFSLCTTQLVQILHRTIFPKSQKSY